MKMAAGMKLFLHRANSRDPGVLLKENNRWIDAKWSPDSRFLAIIDHLDGHIADVYVFGVGAADAAPTLSITRQTCTDTMCSGTFQAGMQRDARSYWTKL